MHYAIVVVSSTDGVKMYVDNPTTIEARDPLLKCPRGSNQDSLMNTAYNVGTSTATADPFNGDLGEVITYSRVLNSSELQKIARYFKAKYNVGP